MQKNSVLLKEVLTRRRQRARRALIDNTAMYSRNDADSARKRDVGDCQYRRKCLCRSRFRYSRLASSTRNRCPRDSSMSAENALRGL